MVVASEAAMVAPNTAPRRRRLPIIAAPTAWITPAAFIAAAVGAPSSR